MKGLFVKMKIRIIIAALLAAFMLTACGKDEKSSSGLPSQTTVTEYVLKDGDTQVTGEVTSVAGNEITLSLGEASESTSKANSGNEANAEENAGADETQGEMLESEMPDFAGGEAPDFAGGEMPDFASGEMPDFAGGEVSDFAGRNKQGGKKRGGSSVKINTTGETAAYIIPVGMTVSGGTGRSSDYSAITVGAAVKITLNADGYVVAAEIL